MAGVVTVGPKTAATTATTPRVSQKTATSSVQKSKNEQALLIRNAAMSGKQAQAIEQQQSLAFVQIMLHASVSVPASYTRCYVWTELLTCRLH